MIDARDLPPGEPRVSGAGSTGLADGRGPRSGRSNAVHYSRAYSLVMLAGVLGLGAVLWFSRSRLPAVALALSGMVLSFVIAALFRAIIGRKPVLIIDETGILYSRGWPSRIAWHDILSVERPPRVERSSTGEYHSFVREAWRPIRLRVRGVRADSGEVTIQFMGLDTDSADVLAWIRDHLRESDDQEQRVA